MFWWILIIIALVAVFNVQYLPKWFDVAKKYGNKTKDVCVKKIEEIKEKNNKKG